MAVQKVPNVGRGTRKQTPSTTPVKPKTLPATKVPTQTKTTGNAAKTAVANRVVQKLKAAKATNLNAAASAKQTPNPLARNKSGQRGI